MQESATQWLWTYNNERPNRAVGGVPPIRKRMAAYPLFLTSVKNGGITGSIRSSFGIYADGMSKQDQTLGSEQKRDFPVAIK